MRLLLNGSDPTFFRFVEFGKELSKHGICCRMVSNNKKFDGYPNIPDSDWFSGRKKFKSLVAEFRPDFVMTDMRHHFGLSAIKEGIPLIYCVKGDFWGEAAAELAAASDSTLYDAALLRRHLIQRAELDTASNLTLYDAVVRRLTRFIGRRPDTASGLTFSDAQASIRDSLATVSRCIDGARLVLTHSRYMENLTRARFPHKKISTVHLYINADTMRPAGRGMDLRHPCVGLVQKADVLGKAREMLTLEGVIASMPEVTFYWAGGGWFEDIVLSKLDKYENFRHLGWMEYPDGVREFLSSVDIYGLASGMDGFVSTVLEAQLLQKPVIATRAGGIPETLLEDRSGFLVDPGDHDSWKEKIETLLGDPEMMDRMGKEGRRHVEKSMSVQVMAREFCDAIKTLRGGDCG